MENSNIIAPDFKKVTLHGMTLVVTGFPRSGTSMMMNMLEAGGVRIIQDTDSKIPNGKYAPEGVRELEDVGGMIKRNKKKWTKNKAVKIVTPYAEWYPIDRPFKAIFMLRDINEIITSLMAMRSIWSVDIPESINLARGYLKYQNIPTLFIKYHEAVKYPKTTALSIQDFLGVNLNIAAMVKRVDPAARERYKTDKSILGHGVPDTIIRMDKDAFKDVPIETSVFDLPAAEIIKSQVPKEEIEKLAKEISNREGSDGLLDNRPTPQRENYPGVQAGKTNQGRDSSGRGRFQTTVSGGLQQNG